MICCASSSEIGTSKCSGSIATKFSSDNFSATFMYSFFRTHERNYIPNSSRPVLKLAFSKTPYKLYLTMRSTPFISLPHILLIASILFSSFCATAFANDVIPDDGKLRIIVFGAHPDDAELEAGGTAALWASMGHHVKFVSTTNGDIGHAVQAGAQLAKRRTQAQQK
jgi:hypothetical protein